MECTRAMEVWNDVLEKTCGCYADEVGNRPCDNGAYCDKCSADWVQEIYKTELEKARKAKKYIVNFTLTRQFVVSADSKANALEEALVRWDDCMPATTYLEEIIVEEYLNMNTGEVINSDRKEEIIADMAGKFLGRENFNEFCSENFDFWAVYHMDERQRQKVNEDFYEEAYEKALQEFNKEWVLLFE